MSVLPAGMGLEEAPDARRRVAGPAMRLRALAVDDVGRAPREALAAVVVDAVTTRVGPHPPVARTAHHRRRHDLVGATVDEKDGDGTRRDAAPEGERARDWRDRGDAIGELAAEEVREEAAVRHAGREHAPPVDAALILE